MTGGSIHDNSISSQSYIGGGVNVGYKAVFVMSGGEIYNNAAESGGGVAADGGVFTFRGGDIYGNTAAKYGGGVYVYQDAKGGSMEGGRIYGNTANLYGGGLCLDEGFTNSANVHFWFTKTGGDIEGYSADSTNSNKVVYENSPVSDRGAAACVLTNPTTGTSPKTVEKTRETAIPPNVQLYAQCEGNAGKEVWTFSNDSISDNWADD
jgi:hypothetical protein